MKHKDILSKLNTLEKANWASGNDLWHFLGNEKLGIREILLADGPHGVRVYKDIRSKTGFFNEENLAKSTMFPNEAAMAATFNPELIYEVGATIGSECNMFNVDVLLGPGVNLKRSPLGGRNFEYYSEDPFLSGKMAVAFINGIQSTGVGACIKHFALNEQETQRRFVNTLIDARTLHEHYLLPFEMVIKEANPYMIMSSYNQINGHYAGESKMLLQKVLRGKWGYDGVVVSDWGGVQHKIKSIKNGMNIEMPGRSAFNDEVVQAINDGSLSMDELDNSLIPLLNLHDRLSKNVNRGKVVDLERNHLVAGKVAEEAIVLLKNNGVLPLKDIKKIGLIGDFAKNPRVNGGGSATLKPYILENSFAELEKYYELDYTKGYIEEETNVELLKEVKKVALDNESVIFFTGTTTLLETEGKERTHMKLPSGHIEVFKEIAKYNKNIIVILNNGSALDITAIEHNSSAIIEAWFLGGANAVALRKVISGEVNPSGRITETFPLNIENTPNYRNFPSLTDDVNYYGDILKNGYRHFDTHNYPVRYPFGYGISYTDFEYSNLRLSKSNMTDGDSLEVTVSVENTGDYDGSEVVQVYVSDVESYYPRPLKELKGFKKVFLKKGEQKDVSIVLDKRSFAIYAVDFDDFRVESGEFNIMVGSNVLDIHLSGSIEYVSSQPLRNNLTIDHPFNNWLEYKNSAVSYIEEKYREIMWYEKEEPIGRVYKRLKKQFNISDEEYNIMLSKLK